MIPYDLGLVYSSNVVTASIITNLIEPSVYEEYLDRFGFFKLVDTDGIAESTGVKNFTWPADKLALTYGQGSTVTMLQMIQAYSAIFNDGTMVKPYVIDQVRSSYDDQNVLYQGQTQVVGNPISVETSKQVQQLMYDTANREDGTARFYQIPETTIIAKTGTTQLAAVGGGGYSTGKTIVSLMAAMPAEDPKVLVYYAFQADYDKNAHVKSDAIKSVLRKVAMTYNFAGQQDVSEPGAPSAEIVPIHESTMPSLINHTLTYAQNKLADSECDVIVLGRRRGDHRSVPAGRRDGGDAPEGFPADGHLSDHDARHERLDAQGGQRFLEGQWSAGQDRRLRQGHFPEYSAGDIGQQADGDRGRAAGIDVSSFTNKERSA